MRPLAELTSTEWQTFCSSFDDWVTDRVSPSRSRDLVCLYSALQTSSTQEACESARRACIASTTPSTSLFTPNCPAWGTVDCSGTVNDFEYCVSLDVNETLGVYDNVSCTDAGSSVEALFAAPPIPAVCGRVSCLEGGWVTRE